MKKYKIDSSILLRANHWSDFKGNEFSIKSDGGKNRLAGNIAEVIFFDEYGGERISHFDRNADFILNGKRIDVKCKQRNVPCSEEYDVSIEARCSNYDVDWYAFYSYNVRDQILEFCGWKSKVDYLNEATLKRKGDIDPSNSHPYSVDEYNLKIKYLI